MSYFDGMILPVKTADKEIYRTHAIKSWEMFRAHGALSMREGWGDDVPPGEVTSLPQAVKLQPDETVVFSWIEWPDRATRDAAWGAIMADEGNGLDQMPFDGSRMTWGGFQVLADCGRS